MSITAGTPQKQFEIVPSGNHVARCYSMVEIGTEESEYMGKKKFQKKVRVTWELPNEMRVFDEAKGEQPLVISKDYTLSMYKEATLRADLESWRGKAFTDTEAENFDITKLVGVPCMVNVIHETSKAGKEYAKIVGVTPVPKGMVVSDQVNPSFVLSYSDWDDAKFAGLPDWLKKRMEVTPEFKARLETPEPQPNFRADEGDDLPF